MIRSCSCSLALTALLFAPAFADAQTQQVRVPPSQAPTSPQLRLPPIAFSVAVVYATMNPGKIDPRGLRVVNRLPMKFKSVEMLESKDLSVRFGDQAKLVLGTGGEIRLLPVAVHQNKLHMQFEMPDVVNTRVKMTNGRPVIVGGVPHRDGYLIIEVRPEFTKYLTAPQPPRPGGPQTFQVNQSKKTEQ